MTEKKAGPSNIFYHHFLLPLLFPDNGYAPNPFLPHNKSKTSSSFSLIFLSKSQLLACSTQPTLEIPGEEESKKVSPGHISSVEKFKKLMPGNVHPPMLVNPVLVTWDQMLKLSASVG